VAAEMHGMFFFPTGPFPASLGPRTKSKLAVDEAFGYLAQDLLDRNFYKMGIFYGCLWQAFNSAGPYILWYVWVLEGSFSGVKLAMNKVSHSKTALLHMFGSICVYSSLSFRVIARQVMAEFCVQE